MTREHVTELARHWIAAWNARDLGAVLGHFADSARFTSPKAVAVIGKGSIEGKSELRKYWESRLVLIQSLRFTLDRVLWDAESWTATIVYVADINGQPLRACEMLRLGADGLAVEGEAMYGAPV
jgi:ketosteroid isomerase-like protein